MPLYSMPLYGHCTKCLKSGKNDGTFHRGGWAELHQTGAEGNQTISSGQVSFRISKSCPIVALWPPADGPLPKMG